MILDKQEEALVEDGLGWRIEKSRVAKLHGNKLLEDFKMQVKLIT